MDTRSCKRERIAPTQWHRTIALTSKDLSKLIKTVTSKDGQTTTREKQREKLSHLRKVVGKWKVNAIQKLGRRHQIINSYNLLESSMHFIDVAIESCQRQDNWIKMVELIRTKFEWSTDMTMEEMIKSLDTMNLELEEIPEAENNSIMD